MFCNFHPLDYLADFLLTKLAIQLYRYLQLPGISNNLLYTSTLNISQNVGGDIREQMHTNVNTMY